ncbi:MAG: group II intron reverse transcriptase/maturase [Candidatus Poribacteria bacterium]|nr:group II intron reverse transcriptase/maturase [Candidatus Poribacteria bacterium]
MITSRIPQDDTFTISNIRKCEEYVLKMQKRLDEAVANNDYKCIKTLTNILIKRSHAVKVLAVWRITYRDTGKNTAGIDGISIPNGTRESTDYIRHRLLNAINISKKPDTIRRVYIPKANGKKRPLGIPTIHDRIIQEIIRITLEPIAEYHFHDNSYGFRPKRRCQDAIDHLHKGLARYDRKRYILEGDIKSCFDHINHDHIAKTLYKWHIPNKVVSIINRMLKARILDKTLLNSNEGTPQGGVISPLLANIALTDFDNFVAERFGTISYHGGKHRQSPMIRYADDFVILCRSRYNAEMIKSEIMDYLSEHVGLTISDEKTCITHIRRGFDFLGFTLKKHRKLGVKQPEGIKDYTLLITPSREKVISILQNCKEVIDKHKESDQKLLIKLLNSKLRGWCLFYKHVNSKTTFAKIDYAMWNKTLRWGLRRHSNKSRKWVLSKYFTPKGKSLYFETEDFALHRLMDIPIERYVKVVKGKRVYNKADNDYWINREKKLMYRTLYNGIRKSLYRKQKGICPQCKIPFSISDKMDAHHIIPKALGGTDKQSNLSLLHAECHRDTHRSVGSLGKRAGSSYPNLSTDL